MRKKIRVIIFILLFLSMVFFILIPSLNKASIFKNEFLVTSLLTDRSNVNAISDSFLSGNEKLKKATIDGLIRENITERKYIDKGISFKGRYIKVDKDNITFIVNEKRCNFFKKEQSEISGITKIKVNSLDLENINSCENISGIMTVYFKTQNV